MSFSYLVTTAKATKMTTTTTTTGESVSHTFSFYHLHRRRSLHFFSYKSKRVKRKEVYICVCAYVTSVAFTLLLFVRFIYLLLGFLLLCYNEERSLISSSTESFQLFFTMQLSETCIIFLKSFYFYPQTFSSSSSFHKRKV